jgi:hypothetical protein
MTKTPLPPELAHLAELNVADVPFFPDAAGAILRAQRNTRTYTCSNTPENHAALAAKATWLCQAGPGHVLYIREGRRVMYTWMILMEEKA